MAVVYAVLCHRAPADVADLVRRLHHPGHHMILHADAKAPAAMHDQLARLAAAFPDVHVLDSVLCAWGGWSLVGVTLRAIRLALALADPWRHFALLSEQHMPLQPPATIAASLPDGTSFIEAAAVTTLGRDARADLLHRFARVYRELPGVGMFACAPRRLDTARIDALRLGSQWVVLARAACERLAGVADDAALWAPFRASLVPDETALPSVLRGMPLGHGLDIANANRTFVAWPHLGAGADGGFTDDLARRARARGHLFIRKRPRVLPPFARAILAAMPPRSAMPPPSDVPEPPGPDAAGLGAALGTMLRARFPALTVEAAPAGSLPACFLRFRPAPSPADLMVCLISQDMRRFKVMLAWRRPFDGTLGEISLAGYPATVMGARLPGLSLAREVHLPDMPDHGFVDLDDGGLGGLATRLALALAMARRLAGLLADAA